MYAMRSEKSQQYSCSLMVVVALVTGWQIVSGIPCTTVTTAAGSRVHCSRHRLTRIPVRMPDDVVELDVSFNFLTSLDALNQPRYHKVQHLFASYNSITNLEKDVFRTLKRLQTLDLSHNALGLLPSDVFCGLTNLTSLRLSATGLHLASDAIFGCVGSLLSLDLSNNSLNRIPTAALHNVTNLRRLDLSANALTTVHNYSLSTLSNLQHLILHSNHLTSLQSAAFVGLEKLITLDLRFNQLAFESGYPPDVFSPLVSLEVLEMGGNDRISEEYPLKVFDPLHSLKTLSIDTLHSSNFGAGFTNLTALKTLTMGIFGGFCSVSEITNNTFTAFHHSALETLHVDFCRPTRIEVCAFCHLPQLTHLSVRYIHNMKISSVLLAFYGIQNQTLEDVNLVSIRHVGPTILDIGVTLYLNNMCVKRLSLRACDLVGFSRTAFTFHGKLLRCLKHLDLSENLLPYALKSTYMKLFIGLISLQSVKFSNQRGFARDCNLHYHPQSQLPKRRLDITFYVSTAPSLTYVNLSRGIRDMDQPPKRVHFAHGGNLSLVDLSYCGAMNCNFTITGLTSIHTFDFSGNDCYIMGDRLFQHMTTLRRLLLSDVYLQEHFLFTSGTAMLQPLTRLEELDLSNNHLNRLPTDLLKYQSDFKRLVLANNRFESLPLDISLTSSLQDLDLRDNQIHILTPSERRVLDDLADNHTITLRLRGNPLSCTCQALDMISWLGRTMVRLDGDNRNEGFDDDYDDNGRDYPCVLEDGSMSSTWSVMTDWESHWRHCVGLSFFTVSLVAQLLQLLGLMMTYLVWSNWTLLVHKWYVLRHVKLPQRVDFDHDALLVYASDEHRMAVRMKDIMRNITPGLRLALVEDEIPLGAFPPDLMVESMDRSWKIIVVVTQDFMEDDLSGYTVLHVQAKLSDTMPRRVLLLYVGDLRPGDGADPVHLSMRRLLHMLPESNVYHVPHDIASRPVHPVWFVLTQAIVEE